MAIILAALIYCGAVPVRDSGSYGSLVPLPSVCALECRLCSSPAKSSGRPGAAYSCRAEVLRSSGRIQGGSVSCEARGSLPLSLPADLVESLYPGHLYSRSGGSLLLESGASFRFKGRWNDRKGVFEVQSAEGLGWGKGLLPVLFRLRAVARLGFRQLVASWGKAGGLVLALLSGSREYLDSDLSESFRRAGLSHVLALSGMHLSFFASLFSRLTGRGRFLLRLIGVSCFVFFAGLSPSLFRAFLFVILLSSCARLNVPGADGRTAMGAVFLIHVLLRPADVQTAAFMLSYAAVAGILFLSAPVERRLAPCVPPALASPLSASLSAFAATAPVSFGLFGCVAPSGIVASIIVSPLIGVFMAVSLVSVVAGLAFPPLSPLCSFVLNQLFFLIERLAEFFSLFPRIGAG
ncbi:MAG: ComEC/Rec2 family competence protein [Treponema sp.]|nr:ComEC/Rec2 family competence protein [Treponema sp.]